MSSRSGTVDAGFALLDRQIIDRDERFRRWMELHTPSGQVPGSEVCGSGAVYLCSDDAWHVHGQMLFVDGGMSAWQQPDVPDSCEFS